MTLSLRSISSSSKRKAERYPDSEEQFVKYSDGRCQIALSRSHYFPLSDATRKLAASQSDPFVRDLIWIFRNKEIAPGFWRQSERVKALEETAQIVDDLKNTLFDISSRDFQKWEPLSQHNLLQQFFPKSHELRKIPALFVKSPSSGVDSLFSRFFFGDYWLKDAFSPQDSLENYYSYSDLLCNKTKMADLLTSAVNSKACLRSSLLTEEIWVQTLQEGKLFPLLLPDQIFYRLFNTAHRSFKTDQLNILSCSHGWAGVAISAAAWAHSHADVSVNLINCDESAKNNESFDELSRFLKKNFALSNLTLRQIRGTLKDLETLQIAQKSLGSKGRIFVGAMPALNQRVFKRECPHLDCNLDDMRAYSLWRRHCLERLLIHSSLFLNSSQSSSLAFWHISKKIRKIDAFPLSESAQIWSTCGLKPLATIFIDTQPHLCDEHSASIGSILVMGSHTKLKPEEMANCFLNELMKTSEPLSRSPRDDSLRQLAQLSAKNPIFIKKAPRAHKRNFGDLDTPHTNTATDGLLEIDNHFSDQTPKRIPINSEGAAGHLYLSQSLNSIGPLQNQLALYPSQRSLFPKRSQDQTNFPNQHLVFTTTAPDPLTLSTSNASDLANPHSNGEEANQSPSKAADRMSRPDNLERQTNHASEIDPNRDELSDYLCKNRSEVENIKKLKEAFSTHWNQIKHKFDPHHPKIIKNFDEMMAKYPNRYRSYRARTYKEIRELPTLFENGKPKKPEIHCLDYFVQCFRERIFIQQLPITCGGECNLIKNKDQKIVVFDREFL